MRIGIAGLSISGNRSGSPYVPTERVPNGTFESGTTGWIAGTGMTLTNPGGVLRITRGAQVNQNNYTTVTVDTGRICNLSWDFIGESAASNEFLDFRAGTTIGRTDLYRLNNVNAGQEGNKTGSFTPSVTTIYITAVLRDGASGNWVEIDNVSILQ